LTVLDWDHRCNLSAQKDLILVFLFQWRRPLWCRLWNVTKNYFGQQNLEAPIPGCLSVVVLFLLSFYIRKGVVHFTLNEISAVREKLNGNQLEYVIGTDSEESRQREKCVFGFLSGSEGLRAGQMDKGLGFSPFYVHNGKSEAASERTRQWPNHYANP
jgi:hypothetical protein